MSSGIHSPTHAPANAMQFMRLSGFTEEGTASPMTGKLEPKPVQWMQEWMESRPKHEGLRAIAVCAIESFSLPFTLGNRPPNPLPQPPWRGSPAGFAIVCIGREDGTAMLRIAATDATITKQIASQCTLPVAVHSDPRTILRV